MEKTENKILINKQKERQALIFNLIFIGLILRIFFLVLIPPFIGIANNGDFERLMSPVGIAYPKNVWENSETYYEYFERWTTNDYIHISPFDNGWHQVFEVFPRMAIILSTRIQNGRFDIRFMGVTNAFFYAISLAMIFKLIRRINRKWGYLLLGVAVLVLGDSYIIQYFNSFYTEIGTVTFTLMLWCMQIYGFLDLSKQTRKKKCIFFIVYSAISVFAILSKQQDVLCIIPIIIVTILLFNHCELKRGYSLIWSTFLIILVSVMFKANVAAGNMTAFNVISCDLLPNSESPELRLKELGLSDSEVKLVMGEIGNNVFSISYDWSQFDDRFDRNAELKIISREPRILGKMLYKRCEVLFFDSPLGNYMKDSGAEEGEKTHENRIWYNIKNKIYNHSFLFYSLVNLSALVLAVIGLYGKALKEIKRELFYVYLMLPISNVIRLLTVMMGDGHFDDIKHFFTINFEFDFIFIANVVLICMIGRYYYMEKRWTPMNGAERRSPLCKC